jgi:hypothetical protein
VAAGLSGEKRKFGSDNVETGGAWNGERLSGFELRDYLPVRERYAGALNLDYRPDADTSYALRGFLSRFSDDEVRDRLTVSNVKAGDLAEGKTDSARVERRIRQRKFTQEIGSLSAVADRRIAPQWALHLEAATSRATEDTPEALNDGRFRGTSNFGGIGFTDGVKPQLLAPAAVFDPASYALNAITLQRKDAQDRAHQLRVDLARDIELADWRGAVKTGVRTTRAARTPTGCRACRRATTSTAPPACARPGPAPWCAPTSASWRRASAWTAPPRRPSATRTWRR